LNRFTLILTLVLGLQFSGAQAEPLEYSSETDLIEGPNLDEDSNLSQISALSGSAATGCSNDYRRQIRRTELALGLGPVVGAAGLFGSGMLALGWEYGGWTAFKTAIGPGLTKAADAAINFAIPTAVTLGFLTYEGIMVNRLIKQVHAHNLIVGLYESGENHQLNRLMRRLEKKGSTLTRDEVVARLIEADQAKKFCDRSLSRRKVASLRDIEKWVLSASIFPGALE